VNKTLAPECRFFKESGFLFYKISLVLDAARRYGRKDSYGIAEGASYSFAACEAEKQSS